MDEVIEPRYCTDAFNMPTDDRKAQAVISSILRPYSLIAIMGLSCTGKTALMRLYQQPQGWTTTKWDRDAIMRMFFTDGYVDDKFYSSIDKLEGETFPALNIRDNHQILVKGWMRSPQTRRRYLSYAKVGKTACLVMDGPTDMLIERAKAKGVFPSMIDAEVEMFVRDKHTSTRWPTFDEGWGDIYYMNTFGKDGVDYFNERLVLR